MSRVKKANENLPNFWAMDLAYLKELLDPQTKVEELVSLKPNFPKLISNDYHQKN